ncbi:MAG: hypothetical protein LBC75_01105 [Fibromonadaceae bacterium]|jgi:hypothetical protein|nr:hypothetical protein [Fibromonadaceae bacterium]
MGFRDQLERQHGIAIGIADDVIEAYKSYKEGSPSLGKSIIGDLAKIRKAREVLKADKKICDKKFKTIHSISEASAVDLENVKGMYKGSHIALSSMANKAEKFYKLIKGKAKADVVKQAYDDVVSFKKIIL